MNTLQDLVYANADLTKHLKQKLSPARYEHTINVAMTAGELAVLHQADLKQVIMAALLHDYAREMQPAELLKLAKQAGWLVSEVEERIPMLLHGPVAAYLAAVEFKVEEPDVIQAIKYHTTGCAGMSKIAALIYVADMIEPGRDYPGLERLRRMARDNIWEALWQGLDDSILYVVSKGSLLHTLTVEARNYLIIKQMMGREV